MGDRGGDGRRSGVGRPEGGGQLRWRVAAGSMMLRSTVRWWNRAEHDRLLPGAGDVAHVWLDTCHVTGDCR